MCVWESERERESEQFVGKCSFKQVRAHFLAQLNAFKYSKQWYFFSILTIYLHN